MGQKYEEIYQVCPLFAQANNNIIKSISQGQGVGVRCMHAWGKFVGGAEGVTKIIILCRGFTPTLVMLRTSR